MIKGQRCPFDTAVAVNIGQYRLETLKFDLCDSLIVALNLIVDNQEQQISTLQRHFDNLYEATQLYRSELNRKTELNRKLLLEYDKLYQKTWLKKNGKWIAFGVGFAAGAAVTYHVIK
jgi:hypothetical protein